MKLMRVGPRGTERPAAQDEFGVVRDLSGVISDIDPSILGPSSLQELEAIDLSSLPIVPEGVRIGPCIDGIGKIICIGLNYRLHQEETGLTASEEPVFFSKPVSAINGPYDTLIKPRGSTKMDWEAELGVVIGQECRYADEDTALKSIAGYCVINDVSERAFQLERGGQWVKGKGCDTFAPIGPWLVTTSEIGEPDDLSIWLEVNGQRYQDSTTARMIHKPASCISYVSQFMSLQPGDIIATGTPSGTGMGQEPQIFLNVGDEVRLGIDGLGEQSQRVVAYDS